MSELIFVGDRGMIPQANAAALSGIEGLRTISALTHRQLALLLDRKVIARELFDEKEIAEVLDPDDPKKRYCLCRNPETAKRETQTRQALLELTHQKLEEIAAAGDGGGQRQRTDDKGRQKLTLEKVKRAKPNHLAGRARGVA